MIVKNALAADNKSILLVHCALVPYDDTCILLYCTIETQDSILYSVMFKFSVNVPIAGDLHS